MADYHCKTQRKATVKKYALIEGLINTPLIASKPNLRESVMTKLGIRLEQFTDEIMKKVVSLIKEMKDASVQQLV